MNPENDVERIAELEAIGKAAYEESRGIKARLLDQQVGRYWKMDLGEEHFASGLIYFYAARREQDHLVGPLIQLRSQCGIDSRAKLEAESNGRFYYHINECTEISAEEFAQGIHQALDQCFKDEAGAK